MSKIGLDEWDPLVHAATYEFTAHGYKTPTQPAKGPLDEWGQELDIVLPQNPAALGPPHGPVSSPKKLFFWLNHTKARL